MERSTSPLQQDDPAAGGMTDAGRSAALEAKVTQLSAELEYIRFDACTLKTLREQEAYWRFAGSGPARPPRPCRHLAVAPPPGGGQ